MVNTNIRKFVVTKASRRTNHLWFGGNISKEKKEKNRKYRRERRRLDKEGDYDEVAEIDLLN